MQENNQHKRPEDFAFRFEYHESNAVAALYHEYVLEVAPDGSGEFRYEADYTDEIVEFFQSDVEALERVYRLMRGAGLLEPTWQPPRRKNDPSGSQVWLEVTCAGNCFETVLLQRGSEGQLMEALSKVVHNLVPKRIWEEIDALKPDVDQKPDSASE